MSTVSNTMTRGNSVAGILLRELGRTLASWWVAYMNWRLEQLAIRRLSSMSDRQLKDIGVSRSQIEFAVGSKIEQRPMFSRYY